MALSLKSLRQLQPRSLSEFTEYLDMARTSVNVTGDLVACSVLDRFVHTRTETAAPEPAPGRLT